MAKKVEDYAKQQGYVDSNQQFNGLFIITDRMQLKEDVAGLQLGQKIWTTAVAPEHITRLPRGDAYGEDQHDGMLGSFVDWWLFSRCRFFVLETCSSFGRSAAAYSLRLNSILNKEHPDPVQLVSADAVSGISSGLRTLED